MAGRKYLILIILLLPVLGIGQVPDNNTFDLDTVVDVVNPSANTLITCFDESKFGGFDPDYVPDYFDPDTSDKSGFKQSYFRNYNHPVTWVISNYVYDSTYANTHEQAPNGLYVRDDGKKYYTADESNGRIEQYSMDTRWQIAPKTYEKYLSTHDDRPEGLFFKPDGTRLWVIESISERLFEWELTEAWNLDSASYVNSTTIQGAYPRDLFFGKNGTRMYELQNDRIHQYNLSTAWDLSSKTYIQAFVFDFMELTDLKGMFFKPDGEKLYVMNDYATTEGADHKVYQYDLSTAWDISTLQYDSKYISYPSIMEHGEGVFFSTDGVYMYLVNNSSTVYNRIYQFKAQ